MHTCHYGYENMKTAVGVYIWDTKKKNYGADHHGCLGVLKLVLIIR